MGIWMQGLAFFVACGLGGLSRWGIQHLVWSLAPLQWRGFGTLAANVLACFLAGLLVSLPWVQSNHRLFLVSGFCGGFSTFSAFALEHVALAKGQLLAAFGLLALHVLLGLASAALGLWLGRQV